MRKRTIDEIKQREFLKMSELAELTGVRYSTIIFYARLGLLPFVQKGKRLARYYLAKEAGKSSNFNFGLQGNKASVSYRF
jgi:hypothetical protein